MLRKKSAKIINKTNGAILAQEAQIADNPFSRLKGLLGKEGLKEGEGLIISPCNSIHTFFMRFSIDVVFIDNNNKVVKIAHSLPPGRLFGTGFKANLVIELSAGTLLKTNTKNNDILDIIMSNVNND